MEVHEGLQASSKTFEEIQAHKKKKKKFFKFSCIFLAEFRNLLFSEIFLFSIDFFMSPVV